MQQPASLLVGTIDNRRVRTRGLHLYDDTGANPGANTIPRFGTDGRILFSTAQVDACGAMVASSLTLSGGLITYSPPSGLTVNGVLTCSSISFRARSFLPRSFVDVTSMSISNRCIPGALAENGKIYCTYAVGPSYMLVIDTATNTTSTINVLRKTTLNTAVYGYNNTIYYTQDQYGLGANPCEFYKFNTQTNIISIVQIDNRLFSGSLSQYYFGNILGLNGVIYCIPSYSSYPGALQLLTIDTKTDTCSIIPVPLNPITHGWNGGALDFSGNIYCAPFNGDNILFVNTVTNTASAISLGGFQFTSAGEHWFGSVLAPNGKIYGVPYNENSILVIDPATGITSTIVLGTFAIANGWAGGVLGMDGKIYCIPYNSDNILVIDPATGTFTTVPTGVTGTQKWRGGVLGPNGTIYGIRYNASNALIIRPGIPTLPPWMVGPEFNKF